MVFDNLIFLALLFRLNFLDIDFKLALPVFFVKFLGLIKLQFKGFVPVINRITFKKSFLTENVKIAELKV